MENQTAVRIYIGRTKQKKGIAVSDNNLRYLNAKAQR